METENMLTAEAARQVQECSVERGHIKDALEGLGYEAKEVQGGSLYVGWAETP